MKAIKYIFTILSIGILIWSCSSSPLKTKNTTKEQPVVIANDSLEYEITIIDPGFTTYLHTIAKPENYYSQNYLENRNRFYVLEWNNRVRNINRFDSSIYENIIDYDSNLDYGYDVNYKLFNYFEFAQRKYRMRLR